MTPKSLPAYRSGQTARERRIGCGAPTAATHASVQPLRAETPLDASAGINAPLTVLNGIGPERQAVYAKLGIETLRDLLLYFPRRYDNYSAMKPINRLEYGEECSVIGTIVEAHARRIRGGQASMLKVILSDATGQLEITFFNQPWLAEKLAPGKQIVVSGRIDQYLGRLTIIPDEWEDLDQELLNTGRIVPVYRLTNSLTQRAVRKITQQVVKFWASRQPDSLPAEIIRAGRIAAVRRSPGPDLLSRQRGTARSRPPPAGL